MSATETDFSCFIAHICTNNKNNNIHFVLIMYQYFKWIILSKHENSPRKTTSFYTSDYFLNENSKMRDSWVTESGQFTNSIYDQIHKDFTNLCFPLAMDGNSFYSLLLSVVGSLTASFFQKFPNLTREK